MAKESSGASAGEMDSRRTGNNGPKIGGSTASGMKVTMSTGPAGAATGSTPTGGPKGLDKRGNAKP